MWFLEADGLIRRFAVLKHEKITQEWLWALEIGTLSESRPEVKGVAHRFLGSVIEIVAERRAYLRFGLYRGDQCLFFNDQEIPFFCRSEKTRKVNGLFLKIYRSDIPTRAISSVKRSINPSIWAPPVTALRKPWSALPLFSCFWRWEDRLCQ
ncbi:MAG: hypothetical protein H6Q42_1884 [Deltaproteobacteria bacterium]|nr:hypothetical protein [Deltaproteobacteria bacterium]